MGSVFNRPTPVVSPLIARQLLEVRSDGRANMFDSWGVQRIADELGLSALVVWIDEVPRLDYGWVLFNVNLDAVAASGGAS